MNPDSPNPLARTALTKCWLIFKDGGRKTFYSFDSSGRYQVEDPRDYGLRGLKKMVARYGDKVEQAILYDNQTGSPIAQLQHGTWQAPPAQA